MKTSRRDFLRASAAAGLVGFPALVRGRNLNSRVCHACIGLGGKGEGDWRNFKTHPKVDLVAGCDVDMTHDAAFGKENPSARVYQHWRELFEKEGDRIDSVNVSTPDHMHTVIVAQALRRRKHVYCQKPLCRGLNESALLLAEAKRAGVVTEIGAQVTGDSGDRAAVRWLREGVIGDIEKVCMYLNVRGAYRLPRREPPKEADPVPAGLDWEAWLGTAPARPYKGGTYYHPGHWRKWRDFGSSTMGDNGFHMLSAVWLGMDLAADFAPLTVLGDTDPEWLKLDAARRAQIWPVGNHVTWTFPGVKASGGKPFTMEWCDGIPEENPPACMLPAPDAVEAARKMRMKAPPAIGKMMRGSKGWLMLSHGSMPVVLLHDGTRLKCPKIARGPGHYHDFLDHVLDGTRGALDFVARGTAMQDALLMGNAAQIVGGVELKWDAAKRAFANSAEATKMLYPSYRAGWTLDGLGDPRVLTAS